MTNKERMLKAARGEWADWLPFAPRLDLWYNANVYRGTLPPGYAPDVSLNRIADDLGVAPHRVNPEFRRVRGADERADRGLGVYRLWGYPYAAELTNVDRVVRQDGDSTLVEYHTPVGSVSCRLSYTEEMRRAGASVAWTDEPVIKELRDYAVVGYIFRHIRVRPRYESYLEFRDELGDRCFAVGYGLGAASPMHHVMKDLVDGTQFYYELADHPRELRQLCEDLTPFYEAVARVLADSPAEVVLMGANYDDTITYAPFFKEHILPWLQRWADLFHAKGKIFLSHCDGENLGLLDLLAESGIDVAESVCAPPMVQCSLGDMRRAFGGKITIFGGVPSVALLEDSMSEPEFETYMRGLFREIAPGDRFILGVSDMVPPDARWERLARLAEMVGEWGQLPLTAP
jgi:hypothetical protein